MTRGQVASVSIDSGFRNAPGMPEPNIFNMWRRRAQLALLVFIYGGVGLVSYRPLESYAVMKEAARAGRLRARFI